MLDIPVDRVLGSFWQNSNAPVQGINYNGFGANGNFIMSISGLVAAAISNSYNQSPVNTYLFNRMSMNNWANNDFAQLLNNIANAISSNPTVANNPNLINNIIEEVLFNTAAYYFAQFIGDFQILMSNNPQLLQTYASRAAQLGYITPQAMGGMAYGNQMPSMVGGQNYSYGGQSGFISPNQNTSFNNSSNLSTDTKNLALLKASFSEDDKVDRNEHEGIPGANNGTQNNNGPVVSKAAPVEAPIPVKHDIFIGEKKSLDDSLPDEGIIANFETYEDSVGFSSFKEISDDVFIRYEKFFNEDKSHFPYVFCPNLIYMNPIPPFSGKANYLMINDMYKKFVKGEITAEEIKNFRKGIKPKFDFIMNILYIQIARRASSIISTFKFNMNFDPHNDDFFEDYSINCNAYFRSINKYSIYEQLKEVLPDIIDDCIFIQSKDNVSTLMYRIPVIVANVSNEEFNKISVNSFKFMGEHMKDIIAVITNDNYLHIIEFFSYYDTDRHKLFQYKPACINTVSILR